MYQAAYRTPTPYVDPMQRRTGYVTPQLTFKEHATVIGVVSLFCAAVARPISKLDQFYFLSDIPGESNRIFLSDKRAQFFRVLFGTRWLSGPAFLPAWADNALLLFLFASVRDTLPLGNTASGFIAGGAAGVVVAGLHHPYDVLRATADSRMGPKLFTGPLDVLRTALREKPAVLLELYKGFGMVGTASAGRYAAQFGVYNALRYDGVYRHPLVLFAYCHFGAFLGLAIQYPFFALKQQLRMLNALNKDRFPLSYRSFISQIRRQHGFTKLFEGFFSGKPVLNAVPPALLMTLYDIGTRRYSVWLHPETQQEASPDQSILHRKPSPYLNASYEFEPKK